MTIPRGSKTVSIQKLRRSYMLSRKALSTVFVTLLFTFSGVNLLAQSSVGGSINGSVSDPTGAAIGNATVTLSSKATGVTTNTTTSSAGQFVFPVVLVGEYSLRVSASGFGEAIVDEVTVAPNK